MKKFEELMAIEERETRFAIRHGLRADVDALKAVYRETREGTPAETVAAFIKAVGYNRAAVAIATLVNRHSWDGRIGRRAAAWAAALPDAWDEKTAVEIGLYVDDVIHLAHFDQIVSAFMKAEPDPDPDGRPETISEDAAPEAAAQEAPETAPEAAPETVAQAEPEAQEERPETISEKEGMKKMKFEKVRYSIIGRFINGMKYGIRTREEYDGYSPEGINNIGIRKVKNWWYIDHIPSGLAVSTYGYKTRDAALADYLKNYAERVKDAETRMEKAVEAFRAAPLDEEVAAWETVNYCGEYEHRTCKLMDAARRAGILYRNNGSSGDLYGATFYGAPEALKTIKKMIAEYEKRDAEKAAEEAAQAEPEAVAALPEPETVAQAEPEAQEERPETISEEEVAPEAAQAEPEAAEADPEAQEEERADGYKPARGPVKPKDFAAEALTGRGWCIVFDSGMNRTRVIVQDGIRETVAPMIEEAGFWWSENMKSYNRKLTHKAHRAAVALAERLREAVAG